MARNYWDHEDKPSGLTKSQRDELAELMGKMYWTAAEKTRVALLRSLLNI
jgi:hypothetical protein